MKNQPTIELKVVENEDFLSFSIISNGTTIEQFQSSKPKKIRSLGNLISKEEISERMAVIGRGDKKEERDCYWGFQNSMQSNIDKEMENIRKSMRKIVKYKLTKRLIEEVELEKFEPSFKKSK